MTDAAVDLRDTGDVAEPSDPNLLEALELAPTSVSVSDPHGRIVFGNRRFWTLFGHDPDEPLDVGMLSRPSDQDWSLSYLTRLVTGDIDEFETVKRFVRGDGSQFDGRLSIVALRHDGRCTGLVAGVEPTEVHQVAGDSRLRKLLEHAVGTITLVELDGNVVETSGRYRTTLGYPPEFWQHRSVLDLIVAEDLPTAKAMRDAVLADPGRPVTADVRVQGADRRIEMLEVTALNMLDDEDLAGVVLSTRNVSEERRNMRAVARLRDDAIAEAEERSHLLATVSHELRNPLHAMSGIVELLASDDTLGAGQRELAGSLLRQLHHLTTVTDDLLDTARLAVGRFELRPAPVVVRDLVGDVVRVARSAAAGRLTVEAAVADDVPHLVTVDPARLQQVLGNLLGNAVKFTEQGSVRLDVSVDTDPTRAGHLVFEVTDTGIGIPSDQTAHVFQPFSTATTSGDRRGAGLGLAIVSRLVEALDGTIGMRSQVGAGSTFTVRLPAVDAVARPPVFEHVPTAPQRSVVLVIEDTPVNQELAQHQLTRLGAECVIAESAEIGLELLEQRDFDAILMDHQLPGMNGREATREIRRRGIETPIIGVTASSTAADERACLDAGMTAFLAKPVGLERLARALDDVLDTPAPSTTAVTTAAVTDAIDVAVLDQLAEELGDREIVAGLVRTFLGELDTREADIAGGDVRLAARQAHTLKSSAKLLGATHLSRICAAAETDIAARRRITGAAAAARDGLRAWLDDPGPGGDPADATR